MSYRGEMSAFKYHGRGKRVKDWHIITGEWKEGKEHGFGAVINRKNGYRYVGELY